MSRFFRVAPFDASVFIITLFFIGALGFFGVRVLLALTSNKDPDNFDLGAGVLLAVIIAYALVRSVRGYRFTGSDLVIERVGPGRVRIPVAEIDNAKVPEDLGNFLRSGFLSMQGLFGWAGKVQIRKPTDKDSLLMDVYGTNRANSVVISLKSDKQLIVTPRDVEGFVTALRESGVGDRPQPPRKSYLQPPRKKKKK